MMKTCHDPECRAAGFRGRPVNVPDEVGTDINEYLLDEELAELDEHKIIQDAITPTDVSHLDFDDPDFEKELCELDISSIVPSNPT